MREYELVTIWNPDLGEDGVRGMMERVTTGVTSRGGQVLDTNLWGRRRLAYIINKHTEGAYVVMQLRMEPARASELEAQLRINEDVLRHLMIRRDE